MTMTTRREFIVQTSIAGAVAMAGGVMAAPRTLLRTYRIAGTDLVVSRIAFGCAMLGLDWQSDEFIPKTKLAINTAYENGVTFFDTADMYGWGKAETALGEVLRESPGLRNRLVIQSKCGHAAKPDNDVTVFNSSHDHIVNAVEGSLKRLGTDRLDVLLLHWPDSLVQPEEVARAFDELKRSGKVRYFGVSNHNRLQIELLNKYVHQPLVANQIQLGLGHWFVADDLEKSALTHGDEGVVMVDYCRVHDIQVQAYSPLRVSMDEGGPNLLRPAADAAPAVKHAAEMLADIARKHDASPAATMLAWLLHHPAGIVPIIGATKPEHVVDNCRADRVSLTREEWYGLLNAAAAMQVPRAART
jgi:predicted oxidoreductase